MSSRWPCKGRHAAAHAPRGGSWTRALQRCVSIICITVIICITNPCLASCNVGRDVQERERLVASAEASTRQRMRQGEVLEKEAAAVALLDGNGVRLQALLGRGQGEFLGCPCSSRGFWNPQTAFKVRLRAWAAEWSRCPCCLASMEQVYARGKLAGSPLVGGRRVQWCCGMGCASLPAVPSARIPVAVASEIMPAWLLVSRTGIFGSLQHFYMFVNCKPPSTSFACMASGSLRRRRGAGAAAGVARDSKHLQMWLARAALPPPARLRRAVEAALEARKADAEHWAGAVAEAQAAAAAKDGELTAQRTQLHKLQADLEAEEERLRHGLEHADMVREIGDMNLRVALLL